MEKSSPFAEVTSIGFCDKDKEGILIKAQRKSFSYKQKLKRIEKQIINTNG